MGSRDPRGSGLCWRRSWGRRLEGGSGRGVGVGSRLRGSIRAGGFAALMLLVLILLLLVLAMGTEKGKGKGAAVLIPGGK